MISLAKSQRRIADKLTSRFGKSVTFQTRTPDSYNPALGSRDVTVSTATVRAVIEKYADDEIGGGIERGDLKLILSDESMSAVDVRDTVVIDSEVHQIVNVETVRSGLTPVVRVVQVRR